MKRLSGLLRVNGGTYLFLIYYIVRLCTTDLHTFSSLGVHSVLEILWHLFFLIFAFSLTLNEELAHRTSFSLFVLTCAESVIESVQELGNHVFSSKTVLSVTVLILIPLSEWMLHTALYKLRRGNAGVYTPLLCVATILLITSDYTSVHRIVWDVCLMLYACELTHIPVNELSDEFPHYHIHHLISCIPPILLGVLLGIAVRLFTL